MNFLKCFSKETRPKGENPYFSFFWILHYEFATYFEMLKMYCYIIASNTDDCLQYIKWQKLKRHEWNYNNKGETLSSII